MAKKKPNQSIRRAIEQVARKKLPKSLQVDHIVPKADGGTDDPTNLQLLPKKVHQAKTEIENAARKTKRRIRARH